MGLSRIERTIMFCTVVALIAAASVGIAHCQITYTCAYTAPMSVACTPVAITPPPPPPPPPPPTTGTLQSAYLSYLAAQGYTAANTYYVSSSGSDSAAGTAAAPWATLTHADSAAPACSLTLVEVGTYAISPFNLRSSGTAACHKAFASQTYTGAILAFNSNGSSNGSASWYEGGSYVSILGFSISGVACIGIQPAGANVTVAYNYVHDTSQQSGYCGNGYGGGGIAPGEGGGTNVTILDNILYNIGSTANGNSGVNVHGIYVTGSGFTIENNVVYKSTGGCIQAYHAPTNGKIINNTLVGCKWAYIVGADSGAASNTVFANNVMTNNTQYSIYECGASSCGVAMGGGNIYTNNISYGAPNNMQGGTAVNNSTANPLIVNTAPPAAGGNFSLQPGSPAIGYGNQTYQPLINIIGVKSTNAGAY